MKLNSHLHEVRGISPAYSVFFEDAFEGLSHYPKRLACKYLYDKRGSQLFEEICQLPEYYPTRTELRILQEAIGEISGAVGAETLLIEYGSGSSTKTRLLLDHLDRVAGYVPIDISRPQLGEAVQQLARRYPRLRIWPVCADYTQSYELPPVEFGEARRVVFFPGSTIGNFAPREAIEFLRHMGEVAGQGGGVLIGVDLKKDPRVLFDAYNDSRGVTAAFNLNLLVRMNRELHTDFATQRFSHYAFYNPRVGRVEMHLVSLEEQQVHLGEAAIPFAQGESIWTESSYKFSLSEFAWLASEAGLCARHAWTDPEGLFSVHYLERQG